MNTAPDHTENAQALFLLYIYPLKITLLSPRYFMCNQELEPVEAAKYQGLSISKDLSWNTYINNMSTSAKRTIGFVKRNVVTENINIKTMTYN